MDQTEGTHARKIRTSHITVHKIDALFTHLLKHEKEFLIRNRFSITNTHRNLPGTHCHTDKTKRKTGFLFRFFFFFVFFVFFLFGFSIFFFAFQTTHVIRVDDTIVTRRDETRKTKRSEGGNDR